MAVPGFRGHLKNTAGSAFTVQTIGGSIPNTASTSIMTKGQPLLDYVSDNPSKVQALPIELNSGSHAYNTKKPYSSGTFLYNGKTSGSPTWVISRIASTLSGASNTVLLFMGEGRLHKHVMEFMHDFGAKLLTAWRAHRFSFIHRSPDGAILASRTNWMNVGLTATGVPTDLTTTNMWDLTDGNATDKANDHAIPTRLVPGELFILNDHVNSSVSLSGNFYDYTPITGK